MRTFVISDAHGHPEMIQAALDHGGFTRGWDHFVFGGDFLDRGTDPQGCLDLIERYATEVLIGNHDLAALLDSPVWPQDPDSPGYRPLLIRRVLAEDTSAAWKAVTAVEGVLVSHAGICASYGRVFRGACHGDADMFAEHLNRVFREAVRWWVESADGDGLEPRGGDDRGDVRRHRHDDARGLFGDYGPFWFRPPPWSRARPLAGVTQVAGHSPAAASLARDGFYMIDPGVFLADFGEPLQFRYAVIEDGNVRVEEGPLPREGRW